MEAACKFRVWSDPIDQSKNGCVHTTNMHSQTLSNDQ